MRITTLITVLYILPAVIAYIGVSRGYVRLRNDYLPMVGTLSAISLPVINHHIALFTIIVIIENFGEGARR